MCVCVCVCACNPCIPLKFTHCFFSAEIVALHPKCLIRILHRKILPMLGNALLRKDKDLNGIM